MAHTDIKLINDGGVLVPSVASVPVVSGDSVSFSTNDGSHAWLFFSPGATSVLSPKPETPFPIPTAGKADFSFAASGPGAYSVYFAADAISAPAKYPSEVSHELLLEVESSIQPPFTGGNDTMTPGH